jgi:hypothetical protein
LLKKENATSSVGEQESDYEKEIATPDLRCRTKVILSDIFIP